MPKVRIVKPAAISESANGNEVAQGNNAAPSGNSTPVADPTRVYPARFLIKPEQAALLAAINQECDSGMTQAIDRCREADGANQYLFEQRRMEVLRAAQKKAAQPYK